MSLFDSFAASRPPARRGPAERRRAADAGRATETSVFALALEPRYLFDAAALATGAEAADQTADQTADRGADKGSDRARPSDGRGESGSEAPKDGIGADAGRDTDGTPGEGAGAGGQDPALEAALAAYSPPGGTDPAREVVFVDAAVADRETLLSGLVREDTAVVVLESGGDALAQIAAYLEANGPVEAVHIVSHGDSGYVRLGGETLWTGDLMARGETLQRIGAQLTGDADVLFYGCDVAAGAAGAAFIETFAELTGADVAASTDATGVDDWELEANVGEVERSVIFTAEVQDAFTGSLATLTVDSLAWNTTVDGQVTLAEAILAANGSGNADVSSGDAADTIVFQNGLSGTITIDTSIDGFGLPEITQDLSIDGAGATITVTSNGNTSVGFLFTNTAGVDIGLANLTVDGFTAEAGGLNAGASATGTMTVDNVTFSNNRMPVRIQGNATLNISDSTFSDNSSGSNTTLGGAILMNDGTLTVANSTFSSNSSVGFGGAIRVDDGTTEIRNSQFIGNSATQGGAAIELSGGSSHVVAGSLFYDNTTDGTVGGGTLEIFDTTGVSVVNNTFVDNTDSSAKSGGIQIDGSGTGASADLDNNIVISTTGAAVNTTGGGSFTGADVGSAGTNILRTSVPGGLFVNQAGDNYRIQSGSIAVDAGDNAAASGAGLTIDLDGDARVSNGTVDIGAYEFSDATPVVTASGGSASFTEDGGAITVDAGLTVTEPEGDNITGATVQITSNYQSGADVLAVTEGSGITASFAAGSGILTLSGTATAAEYQAVLRTLTFNNTSDAPSTATRTLTYAVTDAGSGSAGTATRDVTVAAVNDPPAVANLDGDSFTYTEGDGATDLDVASNATLADPDSGDFNGGSLAVTYQSGQQAEDRIVIDTSGTVSLSAGQTAGSTVSVGGNAIGTLQAGATGAAGEGLTVVFTSADATPAAVQTLLRALQYDNAGGDNPTDGNRVVRVVVADGDSGTSNSSDVTINVDPVNDAPSVTASGGTTAFTEGGGAVTVDSGVTLSDADSATLASATVSITANFQSGADLLAFVNDNATLYGNIAGAYDGGTGVLTLTSAGATATVAQFQNALRAVTFDNGSDTPATGTRTLAFAANDGAAGSTASTQSVSVTAVNDPPAFTNLDGTPGFTEGGSPVRLDADVTAADAELDALNAGNGDYAGASLTIARNGGANADDSFGFDTAGAPFTVSGGNLQAGGLTFATFTDAAGTLTVTFTSSGTTATAALVDAVLQRVTYQNGSDDPPASVQLDWTFSDGNSGNTQGTGANPGTDSGATTVSITGVNDEPTLTATGQDPTYTEGTAAPGVDLFGAVSASTVETADRFSSLTLTVTNVSDGASEILRFDGADVTLTDGTSVTTATNGLGVTVSVTGSTATVSFSGASLTAAQMQTLVDSLAYRNTSDAPTTGANRVVTITQVTDDGGTSGGGDDTASLALASTVSLTAVNDPPTVGNVFGETSQVTAGAGAQDVTGLNDATVANVDSADYDGGALTIVQDNGTANGNWGLDGTTATAGGDGTIAAGETIAVGGVTIGTVDAVNDGQGGNSLEIAFNADATSARVQTLIQALTYSAPSGLGDRDFTLTLNDNDGTASGGDEDAGGSFTLSVTPNPPVIANLDGDSVTAPNGTAVSIDAGGNATVTDADSADFDGGNLTVTRTSGLSGDFSLTGNGATGVSAGATPGTADGTLALGETVYVDGVAVGTVASDGQGGNDLRVDLGGDATPARTQAVIRALQFASSSAGAHTFDLTVTDAGASAATSAAAGFTVNVEAPPVNTVPGAQTAVDGTPLTLAGISVADADSASVTTTVSVPAGAGSFSASGPATVTGGGGNALSISGTLADVNATLANLVYTPAVDATGAQTVTVLTSDGSNSDSDTITVTVSDRPNITGLDGDSQTVEPGSTTPLDLGGDAGVSDNDNTDFAGGTLTLTRVDGSLAGDLSLDGATATSGGDASLSAGETVMVGGTAIGTVTTAGQGTDNLVIGLNADATPARVATLLQNLSYTADAVGTHSFDVRVTDAAGGTTSAPARASITVEAPVADEIEFVEDTTGPARVILVETPSGNLQFASTAPQVSGPALDAIFASFERSNSPLARAFDAALAGGSASPLSQAFQDALADTGLRSRLSAALGEGRSIYYFDGSDWRLLDLTLIDEALGGGIPQAALPDGGAEGTGGDLLGANQLADLTGLVGPDAPPDAPPDATVPGAEGFGRQVAQAAFGFEREAARLAAALLASPPPRG